ncbi:MAG: HDIG domain-containing metalloprotein [Aggregatilineales bacterium]|nr:HDIG domain-containing protein [Aggregatilineales bacterium]HPV06668.1 HDIG domain-containing protein [Aggregatilineales bacterium]HQE18102.1 HDIG domain-containing protein [Aggregatilineales bacterium]
MNAPARNTTGTADPRVRFEHLWSTLRIILIGAVFVLGTTLLLLFPELNQVAIYDLREGDIAPEDIRAPHDIAFVSVIETEARREQAAASVQDVYDPPDPRIGREQVRLAGQIMDFIADVREDPYADPELKQSYLNEISALSLSPETTIALLQMSDNQFELIRREVISLLQETMSERVREGNLAEVRSRLELKVSPELQESLIPTAVSIASDLIVPNSVLNAAATEQARREAIQAVEPVERTYREGEIVVRAGERLTETEIEALQALGLTTRRLTWRDIASAVLVSIVSVVLLAVYLGIYRRTWFGDSGWMLLIILLLLAFLTAGQIMIPGGGQAAYLFPAAAPVLALTALVGVEFASLMAIVLALLVGYLSGGSLELVTFAAVSSLMAAGSLRRTTRLNAYFLAGLAAAVGGAAVLLVFQLPGNPQPAEIAPLLLLAAINGLLSTGLALIILFVVGNVTGITTPLKLIDLLRPDHPLQRRLQQEALGTYQHTLSVANLAEAAAEAIGADSLLTRVGTLYHDIGKIRNPGFFVENRTEGAPDPHDGLSPLASARIIRAHVTDGLDLARRYRLPPRVVEFIAEHHGTMPVMYFLHKAQEEAQKSGHEIDERAFYYDGPAPRSRETAILMLADGCESATRANRPTTGEEIEEIVARIIQQRLDYKQLDDSNLTLTDIKKIQESITRTLKGMYHPRVRYPTDKQPDELEAGDKRALPPGATSDVAVPGEVSPTVAAEQLKKSAEMAEEASDFEEIDIVPTSEKGD